MRHKLHSIRTPTASSPRKRVLIVNCYFDDSRQPMRRTTKIPRPSVRFIWRALLPASCATCAATRNSPAAHSKMRQLLAWPDVLVLTGLTNSFDRMLHLTAYARTKNPKRDCRRRWTTGAFAAAAVAQSF